MKKLTVLSLTCLALTGCVAPAGIAMVGSEAAGAGASAGVEHTMEGVAYRTFVNPLTDVESATRDALKTMSLDVVEEHEEEHYGYTLRAKTDRRTINIRFEKISFNILYHDGL